MAKAPVKIDYFKLPFEVYYGEHIPVTSLDFKSDVEVKKFEDVKIVHKEQGGAWDVRFYCEKNNGPELYCCIQNSHDEVDPEWLTLRSEGNVDMNYGCDYGVAVESEEIKFLELTDEQQDPDSEEYLDSFEMDLCTNSGFFVYELGECTPDYLILDADESRIKVSLDGFVLDDEDNETEERIFNPEELDEDEFQDYTRQDMWEAKFDWVKSTLEEDFPKQTNLKLSLHTE
jgi:hypothetical protein